IKVNVAPALSKKGCMAILLQDDERLGSISFQQRNEQPRPGPRKWSQRLRLERGCHFRARVILDYQRKERCRSRPQKGQGMAARRLASRSSAAFGQPGFGGAFG